MSKNKGKNKGHDNLIPIKPGETRNPNGRPKGQRNYKTIYREALMKLAELNGQEADEMETDMLAMALTKARKGDLGFYKDVMDRLHGKPLQKKEVTGKDGTPLVLPTGVYDKFHGGANEITTKDSE